MNAKQRNKNRETELALHYATQKWSAQKEWIAKLYTPKKPK